MKTPTAFLPLLAFAVLPLVPSSANAWFTSFTEDDGVIRNPGQGWSSGTPWQFERKDPDVNYGQIYIRTSWAKLEPEEGKYDWSSLDGMLNVARRYGVPLSFRIMCACIMSKSPQTPQWVFDKGARGDKIVVQMVEKGVTNDVTQISPRFDDPIFMRDHRRFIAALAEHYDGNPLISGIDLGSFGHWGEWHCHGLPPDTNRYMTAVPPELRPKTHPIKYPFEVRKQYADWYLDNFKKTPIVFMTDDWETLKYAIGENGPSRVGLRRDGVGSPWHFTRWIGKPPYDAIPKMADIWKERPMWFEFFGHATDMVKRGWDVPYSIDWMLTNHVSVVNTIPFSPWELKASDPEMFTLLKKLDLYAGARIVPKKAEVRRMGREILVRIAGYNKGVARIHLPYAAEVVVRDQAGNELFAHEAAADPGTWLPGKFGFVDQFDLPAELEGKDVRFAVRLRHRQGVLRNFRFAVRETDRDGLLPLDPSEKTAGAQ